MSIDPLIDGAALQQPQQGQRVANLRELAPEPEAGAPAPGDQVLLSGSIRKYDAIQLQKERQACVATAIRDRDRSLQLLGQKIDALKAPLQAIIKNFPPFSPQDKARMQLLMNYSSIRKEIEQLTIPPPPDAVQPRETATLPAALPMTASDSQINDHLAKLDAAVASLAAARTALAADTASFFREKRAPRPLSLSGGVHSQRLAASMSDQQAWEKSAQVGRQFAVSLRQGVTDEGSQFLKVLSQSNVPENNPEE